MQKYSAWNYSQWGVHHSSEWSKFGTCRFSYSSGHGLVLARKALALLQVIPSGETHQLQFYFIYTKVSSLCQKQSSNHGLIKLVKLEADFFGNIQANIRGFFAENHDYWQKILHPFSGSQKGKYFIHLWKGCPCRMEVEFKIVATTASTTNYHFPLPQSL